MDEPTTPEEEVVDAPAEDAEAPTEGEDTSEE